MKIVHKPLFPPKIDFFGESPEGGGLGVISDLKIALQIKLKLLVMNFKKNCNIFSRKGARGLGVGVAVCNREGLKKAPFIISQNFVWVVG